MARGALSALGGQGSALRKAGMSQEDPGGTGPLVWEHTQALGETGAPPKLRGGGCPNLSSLWALRMRSSQDESCDWNFKPSPKEFPCFQPSLLPQGCPDRACFTNAGCTHPSSSASPLVCPHLRCDTRNQCQLPKSHLPDSPWPPWQREPHLKDPLLPCHRPQGQKGDRDSDVPPIAPSPETTQKITSWETQNSMARGNRTPRA